MAGSPCPSATRRSPAFRGATPRSSERPQDLAGETIDEQRVRGIDGIVMDRNAGVSAARRGQLLAQHRPLPDIQVECGRQHEEDARPRRRPADRSPGRCDTRPGLPSIGPGGRRDRPQVDTPRARSANA